MYPCQVCGHALAPGDPRCPECGRAYFGAVCPSCHQPAPTIVRGGRSVCTGCGAIRGMFSAVPINVAGQVHRVGAVVASVLSVGFILSAVAIAVLVGLVTGLVTTALTGVVTALAVALFGGLVGSLGLLGSRKLTQRGESVRDGAYNQSILAMAASRHGAVTTVEVAQNLGIPLRDADRVLSDMIGRGLGSVEVNREGLLQYAFRDLRSGPSPVAIPPVGTGVRIDPTLVAPPPIPPQSERSPEEIARERVDREFQAMSDRRRTGGF